MLRADIIALAGETFDEDKDLTLFDPIETWKRTTLEAGTFTIRELPVPVFKNGICVYNSPSVKEIAKYCKEEQETLWDEARRLVNPHKVYVDLSDKLFEMKQQLLYEYSK